MTEAQNTALADIVEVSKRDKNGFVIARGEKLDRLYAVVKAAIAVRDGDMDLENYAEVRALTEALAALEAPHA